ncbi:hypothetical protein FOXB_17471 [Fusarium oxysporum f. sp. conglutinans Fo5176]|uniref:Uncharacterized protein n=1 Tax=Fusarium oxysporum (strain Fo5176) TaxID=660025 RepID=F9GFN7_FUSOF|nr:hypothetical protein FOXB_17471 [Fusarium oxysporum f. sp. conglutinans Fo5176]
MQRYSSLVTSLPAQASGWSTKTPATISTRPKVEWEAKGIRQLPSIKPYLHTCKYVLHPTVALKTSQASGRTDRSTEYILTRRGLWLA